MKIWIKNEAGEQVQFEVESVDRGKWKAHPAVVAGDDGLPVASSEWSVSHECGLGLPPWILGPQRKETAVAVAAALAAERGLDDLSPTNLTRTHQETIGRVVAESAARVHVYNPAEVAERMAENNAVVRAEFGENEAVPTAPTAKA